MGSWSWATDDSVSESGSYDDPNIPQGGVFPLEELTEEERSVDTEVRHTYEAEQAAVSAKFASLVERAYQSTPNNTFPETQETGYEAFPNYSKLN